MVMKKSIPLLIILVSMSCFIQAQKVANYSYTFDNGINVKLERCWNQVWVSQQSDAIKTSDQPPLVLSVRTLGDLTSNSSFKLFSSGKEVKVQGAKPGTYTMKVTSRLSGKPGNLKFDVENVVIKPQSKTTISIILYDYQILVAEASGSQNDLAAFSSAVERYKGFSEPNPSCGIPAFYMKGAHDKPVTPAEVSGGNKKGKIKSGTYDVLITLGSTTNPQKVWLENFQMKPNVSYNITTNLNAGIVMYSGTNKEVKAMHFYPAGTADRQKGTATPDKSLELIKYETQNVTSACPPGTYDVLLNIGNGSKYEWRKNIAVTTGKRAEVK
jgi:hypothetical protein